MKILVNKYVSIVETKSIFVKIKSAYTLDSLKLNTLPNHNPGLLNNGTLILEIGSTQVMQLKKILESKSNYSIRSVAYLLNESWKLK